MKPLKYVCGMMVLSAALAGCASTSKTMESGGILHEDALNTVAEFKHGDPGLQQYFDTAYGYAVFPSVGWTIGESGAFGRGQLYEKGQWAGNCSVTQARVGTPLNGKSYSEVIFFKDAAALNRFESNDLALGAKASAVTVSSGAAASANYHDGVLVFTEAKGGLTLQPTIRGQEFYFEPYYETHSAYVEEP